MYEIVFWKFGLESFAIRGGEECQARSKEERNEERQGREKSGQTGVSGRYTLVARARSV